MSDPFFLSLYQIEQSFGCDENSGSVRDLFALPGVPMHRQVPSYKMYRTLGNAHRNTRLGVRNDFIDLRFKDIYIYTHAYVPLR